jgi:alpha-N-arabinofuranosidase
MSYGWLWSHLQLAVACDSALQMTDGFLNRPSKEAGMKRALIAIVVFASLLFWTAGSAQESGRSTAIINADQGKLTISKHIYGHFAEHLGNCIYGGIWVGENSTIPNVRGIRKDVVAALRQIQIPNLRWPGGCFADTYHWMDGIGPSDKRPSIVNTNWGGVTEDNHFGTHEFMDFCEQIGAEPYITGNVGSGTVREMEQWVQYLTHDGRSPMADLRRANGREKPWRVSFWGLGNETWGCGGSMRPEYYADVLRQFQSYLYNFGGNRLFKIACGASDANYGWTDVLMRETAPMIQGLSLHYYTVDWANKGSATQFTEREWFKVLKKTLAMSELIERHATVMDKYDPRKRVGLIVDEWGTWYDVEPGTNPGFLYQQNTLRDALVAGINLNIFNNHCERVRMANIAQTINVLQSVILTKDDKMVLTPTYHVFDMYKVHQDATLLPLDLKGADYGFEKDKIPAISMSASKDKEGRIHVTLCNLDPQNTNTVTLDLRGAKPAQVVGRILTADAMNAHNTFEKPETVKPAAFSGARLTANGLEVRLPAKSVVVLELQ